MTIQQIIETLNTFTPFEEDDLENDNESCFYALMEEVKKSKDYELAFDPIFKLIEKYPQADFGTPGPFVHTLESFPGKYEDYLFESLKRKPTSLTVLMFNRIINGEQNSIIKQNLIDRLPLLLDHPLINEETVNTIKGFIEYQNEATR